MTESNTQVLIGGPKLVERALGERLTKEALGGAEIHLRNGVVNNGVKSEEDAFRQITRFLSYLPTNVWELPPRENSGDPVDRAEEALLKIIPRDRRKPYSIRRLLKLILDNDSFFELTRGYGSGQVTGFARLGGYPVGVLANDCHFYAGAMNAEGAQKVRRFVEMCINSICLSLVLSMSQGL